MSLLLLLPNSTRLEGATLLASPCTLGWNLSQDASITGYALYFGIVGTTVTNRQDLGMTNSVTIFSLLAASSYFFYVVAYDAAGVESPPSNILYYQPQALSALQLAVPSRGTVNVQFQAAPGSVCQIQYTSSLNPVRWHTLGSVTADANGNVILTDRPPANTPSRFYRAVIQ